MIYHSPFWFSLLGALSLAYFLTPEAKDLEAIPAFAGSQKTGLQFRRIVIDSTFSRGYQLKAADLNGDGLSDLIAVSTTMPEIYWYENPGWERHLLFNQTSGNIDLAPLDIDGDQDFDLAIASGFSLGRSTTGGQVHWLENLDHGHSWSAHLIDSIPTSHRLRWMDIDGDNRQELINLPIIGRGAVSPDYLQGVEFCYYKIPENPAGSRWRRQVIDTFLHMAHGLQVIPWAPPQWSILTASFEGISLFRPSVSKDSVHWVRHRIGTGRSGDRPRVGSSEVGWGNLRQERFIASIEPWHGNEVVIYQPTAGESLWHRKVIDTTFVDGHALVCADLDKDGSDEIIAGHRGRPFNLYVYQFDPGSSQWIRQVLDSGGMSTAGLCIQDFDNDGWLDIAAAGSTTDNIILYQNLGQ